MLRSGSTAPASTRRSPACGLSMIELMVGVVVAMVVVGGAIGLFVGNLGGSRQLLSETRLNQDLRAAVDVISAATCVAPAIGATRSRARSRSVPLRPQRPIRTAP